MSLMVVWEGSGHVAYVSDSAQPVTVVTNTEDDLLYQVIEQNSTIKRSIASLNSFMYLSKKNNEGFANPPCWRIRIQTWRQGRVNRVPLRYPGNFFANYCINGYRNCQKFLSRSYECVSLCWTNIPRC